MRPAKKKVHIGDGERGVGGGGVEGEGGWVEGEGGGG